MLSHTVAPSPDKNTCPGLATRHRAPCGPGYASRLNSAAAHSRHPLAGRQIIDASRQVPVRRRLHGAPVRRGAGAWGSRCENSFSVSTVEFGRTPYWLVLLTVLLIDAATFFLIGGFEFLDGDAMAFERKGPGRFWALLVVRAIALGRPRRVREALARSQQIGPLGAAQPCARGRLAVARHRMWIPEGHRGSQPLRSGSAAPANDRSGLVPGTTNAGYGPAVMPSRADLIRAEAPALSEAEEGTQRSES